MKKMVMGDMREEVVVEVGEVAVEVEAKEDPVVELRGVVMEEEMEVVGEADAVVEVAEMAVEDSYTILAQKITLTCREYDLVVLEFFQISSELEYMVNKLDTLR